MKKLNLLLLISLLFVGCGSDGGDDAPENIVNVSSVSISPTKADITVGKTLQLSATVTPPDATNKTVSWFSSSNATRAELYSRKPVTNRLPPVFR
jgi:uncharacterized protein YcfL